MVPLDDYLLAGAEAALTPALVIYADHVRANIETTLRLLATHCTATGHPSDFALRAAAGRWRPHIKTAKLGATLRLLTASGVTVVKCATSLELMVACQVGATDVLVAYPVRGANAQRVVAVARLYPQVRVSALVEDAAGVAAWAGTGIGLFVDLNPGMDRTGLAPSRRDELRATLAAMKAHGIEFRGLHYYDGHLAKLPLPERTTAAHRGYDELMQIVADLGAAGEPVPEIVTAGTPALPCSLSYPGFGATGVTHRISPGTVVYNDVGSLAQLPAAYGYRPAALVLTRVVSHPKDGIVTCDAGHKTVSADCGVPNCVVLGHPELEPLSPSEEHMPLAVGGGAPAPARGELLYLLPKHVCPTVNNFDHALWVEAGAIRSVENVSARGRERPV